MESHKADVQRLSLLVKEAIRNITSYLSREEAERGISKTKGGKYSWKTWQCFSSFIVLQPGAITEANVRFSFLSSNTKKEVV